MTNVTYAVESLHFGYGPAPVLAGISTTFEPGLLHAIVGPNGSGKSTLLDLLTGYRQPNSGRVLLNGKAVDAYRSGEHSRLVAAVPQEFDFKFPFTVRETVFMGRHPHVPRFSRPSEEDERFVNEAMQAVDIAHLADRPLSDLSGGERQRTVLARSLAQATPALLLDEPTSSMDIRHALSAMSELKRLAGEERRTIIAVLHDLNLAATFCDRVVMLGKGRIHAEGSCAETLTAENIGEVFGVRAEVVGTSHGITISFGL